MSKLEEMRKLREAERIELLNDKEQNPELYNSDLRDNIAYDSAIYRGEIAPKNDGVIGEAADAFNQSIISTAKGVGNTLEKVGLGSDTKDYFEGVLRRNRQWDAPENQNALSYVGRAIGSAAGSTAGTLAAGALGSLIAPGVGTAAGLTVGFMQTFGDNVDRNLEAGYSEDKAYGMAFLESAVDTAIEHAPFGIIGKGTKNTYRAARAAVKGKGALLKSLGKQTSLASKVGKKLVQKVGRDTAENLLLRWGKSAALDGIGEAGEEGFQYLNSYLNQKLGGDPNAEFSLDELADSIAQGFIGGFFLQAARSTPGLVADSYRKRQRANAGTADNQPPPPPAGTDTATVSDDVPEYTMPQNSTASNIALAANDSEAQIISTIDNMSDEAVRAAVGRLNMPGVDVANTPIEILRKNYIDYEINKEREAVRETAAASPAPVAPATPVTAENSISRETLTPAETPIATPEVTSAPVAPVNTPAPAASPANIPVAETASVETPANDIPEYTMQSAIDDASIDYQLQKPVVSDTAIIDNRENLNTDVDVVSSDTAQDLSTPTADIEPLSFSEASKAKDKRAAEQYEKKAYEQLNKKIKIDLFDTETVKDKDLRQTLAAAKRIFHALGMGKLVTVEQVGNEPLFLGVTDTENEETRKRVLLDVKGHKGNNALLFHTARHELVHNLIANNQKAYQKLKEAVIDKIYNRDYYNELFDNYAMNRGWDLAEITKKQQATIEEEFICDTVADLMQTEKFWEILAAEDMSLAQKFLKALKDLLTKITSGNQNNIPKTQQIFQNNLNDVISLAQQFIIESSKKDISSLIRAKNKTETTATAPTVPVSTTPSTSDLAKRMHSAIESGKKLHQFSQKQLDDVFDFLIDNADNDTVLGEIDADALMSAITVESESRDEAVTLDNVDQITDDDFNNPFRNIVLPALPQKLLNLIGKKSKPVLLKKNILDKNKEHHPDLSAEDNRKILDAALYHAEEIINDKPSAKPNYWVLAKIDGKSSIVTIEISETKDAHEIVGWHFANEKAMDKIRNRANREGGQVLITKSNAQGSSDLYDLPADTTNTIPQSPEKSSAEDKKTPTLSDKIRKKPESSDTSKVSDRQTFSDKFRAKEKEITGVNNPNIIIAESTPQGLKSVEKGDTLKETETSAKTITEDKSNDQRTLGGNTGLSSDTNASASHDGVSETTSDRTAGEKGTGGVSGSDVRKSDGTASAGKSSVAAESGLRNSDGDGSTAGGSGEQKTGEVVSGGNRAGVRDVERASSARVRSGESASAVKKLNANNFRITPDTNLVPAGDVSKTQANIEAIKLIKTLDKENRQATAEEKQILAKYTGWGGLSNVFYPGGRFYSELKSLLTQKEFQDAQASTINAHYTERGVITAMWDVASHLGFKGGKVGEFGAGVGHFLGLIPDKLFNKTAFKAVELDTISGKILQYLYPGADVTIDGLEHVKIANNSLDMVIGNFPFAKEGPYDRNYPKFNLHNYFFARAIDAVKPGGLVVALTSNSTLDSINQDARKYFAERADFVGAIRLPNNAFKKNAGTEVVTDIIVFRKHDGTESNLAENKVPFLRSVAVDGVTNDENNIRVNEYFVNAHPDMVLGKITSQGSMYRGDSMTVEATTEPDKLPGLIEKALKKLPKDIMGAEKVEIVADTADMVLTDEQKKALREGEVFVDKLGTPMIYQDGKGVLFTKATDKKLSQNEIKKIQSFVKLKETYNSLMETMRSDASDAEVKKQQQQLNKIYDEHVKKFGYLSERRKYANLVNDPSYLRMSALENKETITDPDNPKKNSGELKLSTPGDRGDTSLDPVDYRRSIDPLFDFFMEYSDNGILNPGSAHIGEDFSGSFISPEFVAFSIKRKQGKNESDATYRKYLERRQNALENASGASLDTMAKDYVEKFGGDEAEVAEKFLDMLRHLSKKDLISERAEAKREEKEAADRQRKEDEAEWQKQKAETLRKKVDELFKAAKPVVDKRWIQINRQIYMALFKTVFPDAQTIPDIPSDREMRILNMVLENGNMSEAALIAEPYYTDKDKVLKDKLDKAQAETLTEFILRSRGGKGFLGLFHDINGKPDINLLEYALMTPMWIAKKFTGTVVESIYKAARMMVDDKNRIMRYLSGDAFEKLMQLRKLDKAMYDKLNAYILKCDRDQTGAGKVKGNKEQTEFTATTADGEVIGKFDNEESAWDALFKREQESLVDNGYSKLAAESLYEIRSAMRRSFLFRLHSTIQYLRQAGLIDAKSTSFIIRDPEQFFPGEDIPANQEIDLFELMREMGQRSGYYMPRIRHGRYMLRATKAGHPVILKGFDSKAARAWAIRDYRKEGYKTENFLANTPDQDMLGQLNPAALSDILNQAMERAKDVFSKDIQIDEVSYVTKDGKTVPQLAVTSKMKLSYAVTNTLKKLGGRYYDGAWRFDNFTPETKNKLKEIIESEVTNEVKSAMVMQSVIGSSIVDMIRENSSGSSKIARRTAVGDEVVQGYEEDVLRAYGLYIGGVSGASARNVMAKKMYAAFGGMDFDREEYINSLIPENLEKGTPEYQEALLNATTEYFKEVHRRALNSAKSPRIAKYMDKYIKDMLRNSTSLDRVLGAAKGISAVWMLNKPASAINNLFGAIGLVPAVIDTETKCGIGFALGNMLSGLNKYIKYAAYNKWGMGKPVTGVDSRIFDIIHKNRWDGAEMVADATKAGLTFAGSKYQAFSNFMLGMFSMVESGNRASSIYAAAMALAKKRGVNLSAMNDVQLQDFLLDAVKISDFGNGVYDKTNKLTWARGGDWQSVIDSALLFKTYEVNYYNNMWNMFNHKNLKGLLCTTASILAMGGGKASIPVTALLWTLLWTLSALGITDPDDEEESDEYVYNLIADVAGQGTANVAKYGIPSLLGINLSGTYRDTITDALHDGVPDGTISISDLPAYSIFKRYKNMKEYGFTQPGKMVEEILPAWGASAARSIREANTGVTDRAGRQRKDVNNEYIKPDGWDTLVRAFGFNPVSISEKTDRIWTEKKVKEKYAEQRREIYARYRDYMKSGDTSDSKLAQLALDIEEYNAKVARSNRNIPLIDEAGLNRAAKDTESKFLKSSLDEKAQQRREKKEKGKIVIRNGKLVREEE